MNNINIIHSDFVSSIIEQNTLIKHFEKDKYGEVFTPEALICKMINELPNTIWEDPCLKWLEPTAGIGHFMMIIYLKLMKGLEAWQSDEQERSKHIIKNMLFMVEINKENTTKCKHLFGETSNVLTEDFLTSDVFHLHFDVIIGNPPFQDDTAGKKRVGKKNKLYERILTKCLSILNLNGYLCFITPDNLFSGGSNIYKRLLETNVMLIHLDKNIQTFFPKIQEFMCYFLLQNTNIKKETRIITKEGNSFECILQDRPVNPVRNWNITTEKLIEQYISNTKNNGIYNRGKAVSAYNGNGTSKLYEIIYKPGQKLVTDNVNLAIGFGQPKIVIFLISTQFDFEIDLNGLYGVGPNTFYFPIQNKTEGILLERFLKSDVYRTLLLSTKTNRQFIKLSFIQYVALFKNT